MGVNNTTWHLIGQKPDQHRPVCATGLRKTARFARCDKKHTFFEVCKYSIGRHVCCVRMNDCVGAFA